MYTKFEVRRPCHSEGMAHDVSALMGLVTLTFDLETGMRVASKVGNLPSKCGHARPLLSRIIRYVRYGRTDTRTEATLIAPVPAGGIINRTFTKLCRLNLEGPVSLIMPCCVHLMLLFSLFKLHLLTF